MATNVKRKKKAEVMSEDGSMTLTGHLKELRNRLIICAVVFVVGVIGFLAVSDKLIDLLTAMARFQRTQKAVLAREILERGLNQMMEELNAKTDVA